MRRRLTTLKARSGGVQNGNGAGHPRSLIDETVYREHRNHVNAYIFSNPPVTPPQWDPQYSGWSNPSRPRNHAIFLRGSGAGAPTPGPPVPPIDLGTAADFGILAKTAISTTGTSSVDGDMGISPAAASFITGFALVLDGSGTFSTSSQVIDGHKVYAADYSAPTPAKMTLAISDMEAAYTAANDLAPTHPVNFEAGILGGQTLTPGVWKWTTGVTIDSNLTLDGAGTYVLQIDGTMELGPAAEILLAGGATVGNVIWVVAGASATLNTTSSFQGELPAGPITGIVLNNGATVLGRLLSQTDVTLIHNTIVEA